MGSCWPPNSSWLARKQLHGGSMGRYTLARDIVSMQGKERTYVYKKDEGTRYLYHNTLLEYWCVGRILGDRYCTLAQPNANDKPYYTPPKTKTWKHTTSEVGFKEDKTLKVYPCYF